MKIIKVAPAKLNLFLHVVGRRTDGYHLLESLFAFTKKGDEILVEEADQLALEVRGPFAEALVEAGGSDDNNLVLQAAYALQAYSKQIRGAKIFLIKNLPIASGIGGGSADAAATLIALNQLWKLDLSEGELRGIALKLGADVPACLHATPLHVSGIGENIRKATLPQAYGVLLVNPGAHVTTPAIFKKYHASKETYSDPLERWEPRSEADYSSWLRHQTNNDLENPAIAECSDVAEVLAALGQLENTHLVRMSGSGATCFALFSSLDEAKDARGALAAKYPAWWLMADQLNAG